jgi:hypothetical protein
VSEIRSAARWSKTLTYNLADEVFYSGQTWAAVWQNTNHKPGTDNRNWSSVAAPAWSRNATYTAGSVVSYAGYAWIATTTTGGVPGGPGWNQIPAWSASPTYQVNAYVFNAGQVWQATASNQNNPPGDPWTLVQLTPYEKALQKADDTEKAERYKRELHAGLAESRHDPPPAPPDGVKVTLSAIGGGLTVDKSGRALLPQAFVFQCGPLEQYTVAHTFNMGTYDTVDDDQFARRGSRQLDTWQFDTLAMYLGATKDGRHYLPGWVPYPTKEPGAQQYHRPEWYVDQLRALFDAGAPFLYVAAFKGSSTIHRTYALLTAFNEDYRHGEGDAIYLSAVSFMQWRDPRGTGSPQQRHSRVPARVHFRKNNLVKNGPMLAWDDKVGQVGSKDPHRATTLCDLARFYYHDPGEWRTIAKANNFTGGSGNISIYDRWSPKASRSQPLGWFVNVPKEPEKKPAERKVTKQKVRAR